MADFLDLQTGMCSECDWINSELKIFFQRVELFFFSFVGNQKENHKLYLYLLATLLALRRVFIALSTFTVLGHIF